MHKFAKCALKYMFNLFEVLEFVLVLSKVSLIHQIPVFNPTMSHFAAVYSSLQIGSFKFAVPLRFISYLTNTFTRLASPPASMAPLTSSCPADNCHGLI